MGGVNGYSGIPCLQELPAKCLLEPVFLNADFFRNFFGSHA